MTSFADLGVPARLVEALAAAGITEPFPVQAATLPDALAGKDLCGRAPTGSGKTLGFGIPLMTRISQAEPTKPTGLVLVPTRELAEQVQRAFVPLGRAQWRFIQAIYGGASFGPQIHSLRKGCSVVVATPGRLLDIIEKGYCDLSKVEVCVIDEADRMADLGFMPDVRKILDMTPVTRQTMLFSATLDGDVNELIREYMNEPARHDLMADFEDGVVDHRFVVTRPTERLDSAVALIEEHGPTIIFVKTRFGVDDVTADLNAAGVTAGALHGARSQAVRQRTLEDFKRGKIQALVATDVAARGIHVDNVSLVLHYDMPDNDKDYTHRSGRTGRAGNTGVVVAFVPPSRQRIGERMAEAVSTDVTWSRGETPIERLPREGRETGMRDRSERGDRDRDRDRGFRNDRGDRPSFRERSERSDRPTSGDWTPRPRPGGDRDARPASADRNDWTPRPRPGGDRDARPASADRNNWTPRPGGDRDARPASGDRNNWTPRPGGDRDARPASGGRNDWTPRHRPAGDNSSYGAGRGDRGDRPAGDRTGWTPRPRPGGDRDARPASGDRNNWTPRSNRPNGDRDARPAYRDRNDWSPRERPAAGGDRSRGNDWTPRANRPNGDRPTGGRPGNDWTPRANRPSGDRPQSNDWSPRPNRSNDSRPAGGGRPGNDWSPRPRRDNDWTLRPDRADASARPARPAGTDDRPARPAAPGTKRTVKQTGAAGTFRRAPRP